MKHDRKISVVGLGYVGLPVAVAFAKSGYEVVGFDISEERIRELSACIDRTREVQDEELRAIAGIFTTKTEELTRADFHIVTVPTPVNEANQPDLTPLKVATRTLGKVLKRGDIVVFESTVYPGATEEECVPILEQESGLEFGVDFAVGYSPERINPGDKEHRFETIPKVVSASSPEALEIVANVYGAVVTAGIFQAGSIKVAEAAKVIENTQRDLNIALMNELAMICEKLDIVTTDVLAAASTKWNFLPFKPGLVGGHCIGVDPYYLTAKAEAVGYHPQVILAGRRINDGVPSFLAQKLIRMMIRNGCSIQNAKIGVLGVTFKEDVPDLRNSKVPSIVRDLEAFGLSCLVHDPLADAAEAKHEYGISLVGEEELTGLDALVVAVPHQEYGDMIAMALEKKLKKNAVVLDVKAAYRDVEMPVGVSYWCF